MNPHLIRMIAVDIDGTLLGEDGLVSARNRAALQAAHAAGVEIVVATGRRHCYAMRVLRPLNLPPGILLVSSNGTVTRTVGSDTVPTRLISRTHLQSRTARWLLDHIEEFRDALVVTFDRVGPDGEDSAGALVVEHLALLHASIGRWMAANEPYIAQIQPLEAALAAPHDQPIQMMLCGTVDRMRRAEARLLAHPGVLGPGSVTTAAPAEIALHRTQYPDRDLSILDILPAGCSKGVALLEIARARGLKAHQLLAIGDNWNDLPMFEAAGAAHVMGNAPEELKALAGLRGWTIGVSNHQHGVAEAIETVLAAAPVLG
ncbi:MAG: Cof-type HAD-IIB family hydrolase [Acidobacteriota bacterium]|nr:Cof-type HAD-IIB family hydrolase [Acidobacteriota bacterium]